MVGLGGGWPRFEAYSQQKSDFCSACRRSVSTHQVALNKKNLTQVSISLK